MVKRQLIIISALIVMVIVITVYIELGIKSQNVTINSNRVNPFAVYFHSNLNIVMDNKPVIIPSQIGINKSLWNDHSLDKYGVTGMPMDEEGKRTMPGMAPLYTTNNDGRITVGSIVDRNYTLGEFLNIWGQLDLNDKKIIAFVDNESVSNYSSVVLKDDQNIILNISVQDKLLLKIIIN
ncbi:MAG: hypothetical protein H0W19_02180 [Nitrosopumilus sp.]|nr:hypothetical protein [Nitrosopumilus sp.]